jgi:hypothetical protein
MKNLLGLTCRNMPGRISFFAFLVGFLLLLVSMPVQAQYKWDASLRGGVNLLTNKLGDDKRNTGAGFEATIGYRLLPPLSVYAGWSWNRFALDQSFAGVKADFEETGYTFGLQYRYPLAQSNVKLQFGVGGIYNHIEVENTEGNSIGDSGHGLGWQAEAGLLLPLGSRLSIMPGIRYRSLSRDIEIASTITDFDFNYLSGGVSLSLAF